MFWVEIPLKLILKVVESLLISMTVVSVDVDWEEEEEEEDDDEGIELFGGGREGFWVWFWFWWWRLLSLLRECPMEEREEVLFCWVSFWSLEEKIFFFWLFMCYGIGTWEELRNDHHMHHQPNQYTFLFLFFLFKILFFIFLFLFFF